MTPYTTTDGGTVTKWPDPGEVSQFYKGKGRDRPRFYRHLTHLWERPGVTSILSVWDKAGLIHWAANLEREACLDAAAELYNQWKTTKLGSGIFRATLESNLGRARSHVKAKEKAADIGTSAHEMVQWKLRQIMGLPVGPEPEIPDESWVSVMAWEDHWNQAGLEPVRMEQPVWSARMGYAGTVDLFARREGRLGIVDLKTAKGIYPAQHLQVGAYVEAAQEMIDDGVIVTGRDRERIEWAELWRVPKTLEDLGFEVVKLGDLKVWNGQGHDSKTLSQEQLIQAFKGILTAWQAVSAPCGP